MEKKWERNTKGNIRLGTLSDTYINQIADPPVLNAKTHKSNAC
jgi:hypothetical protein